MAHFLAYKHKVLKFGDDFVDVVINGRRFYLYTDTLTPIGLYYYLRCKNPEVREFAITISSFLEFLPFLTQNMVVKGLTENRAQFAVILRQNNQMTFPKPILDELGLSHPIYGTVVVFEMKKIILRDGRIITNDELLAKLQANQTDQINGQEKEVKNT